MNKKINIWGRDFNLNVMFDVYEGEEVLDIQKEALQDFLNASYKILGSCEEVKEYCLKENQGLIEAPIENIFRYVMPEYLYIKRDNRKHIVILLCNYKFDEEHGIALTFEDEKLTKIGSQDEI